MTTVEELKEALFYYIPFFELLIHMCQYGSHGKKKIKCDLGDPNSVFLNDELLLIRGEMQHTIDIIRYLKSPVKAEGLLHKGPDGYYLIEDVPVSSFDVIEICIEEEVSLEDCICKTKTWSRDWIQYEDGDSYFYSHKDLPIEGIKARIREPIQKQR